MAHGKNQTTDGSTHPPSDRARRSLLNGLWLGLSGIALAEILWMAGTFLKSLKSGGASDRTETIIDAGTADQFSPDTVTAFPRGRFYLACLEDGGFIALSRRCTHLGCTVPWDALQKRFACPCHASVYDIRGQVVQSPAARPLDRFEIKIENGRIRVDTSRPIRRSAFRQDQVVYR